MANAVDLTADELRVVARYAVESAREVLPLLEEEHPRDLRPRSAIQAAWEFVDGAAQHKVQRTTALEAHWAAEHAESCRQRSAGGGAENSR